VIVELFGPPGAGKTTFSKALAARLREAGRVVDLHLSARPGEDAPASTSRGEAHSRPSPADPFRRVARPLLQLIAAMVAGAELRDSSTEALVSKLPRGHPISALRMRQYLVRLSAAWCDARNSRHIVIFDQGYVQAISSILLSQAHLLDEDVVTVLAAAPPSDLAIHVSAPASEIEARLKLRGEAIGRFGRMFESELGAAPDHVHAARRLDAGLKRIGRTVLEVDSANAKMLGVEIDRLQLEIDGLWGGIAAE
jgi:RecA/RadA recombinase